MHALPFDLVAYDKAYTRKGPVGSPISMSGEVVHNGAGTMEFTIPADHPRTPDLTASGARVVCTYRPEDADELLLLSGAVEEVAGHGSRFSPRRTFQVIDDWTVLSDEVQLWPNPTGTLAQQNVAAYDKQTGPAETVLKNLLAPNVTRQGTNLTVPASAGLGSTLNVKARFKTPADLLGESLTNAGIAVRIVQQGTFRVLEVTTPDVVSQVLTQESGVVVDGEFSRTRPTVTRVLLAAQGEGTARVLRQKIDAALEAEYDIVLPAFIDARDIDNADADAEAQYTARMDETLAEGAPKASLKASLTETGWFQFGKAYHLGSQVQVRLAGETDPIEDYIRAVAFSWTPDQGVTFTPRVGEWQDVADDPLIRQVVALTRAVGNLERR